MYTPDQDNAPSPPGFGVQVTVTAAIVMVAFLIFVRTLGHEFIHYDDYPYVLENANIRGGMSFSLLHWAFTSFDDCLWAPLMRLSHWADYQLFGLNPAGHHLSSVLLHSASAALLLWFIYRATGSFWAAALAAALFAWHPLRVEAVAWVAARKEVLCGFFWLWTLIAYDAWVKRRSAVRAAGLMAAAAMAMMSKPMAVSLPCVLLLLDYWPYRRVSLRAPARETALRLGRLALEKAPLFAMAAGTALLTVFAEDEAIVPAERLALPQRIANSLVAYIMYFVKTIWPDPLAIPYMRWPGFAPWWKVGMAAMLLTGLCAALWLLRDRQRPLFVGALWFLGALVPVIGIVSIGHHAMADRFSYIPHMGLFMGCSCALAAAAAKAPRRVRAAVIAGALLAALALPPVAWRQTGYWKNSATLFAHTLTVQPFNYVAHCNIGTYWMWLARPDLARPHFERAVTISPDSDAAWNDLAAAQLALGQSAAAADIFGRLVERAPEDAELRVNYGAALLSLGRRDAARREAQAALQHDPHFEKAHRLLSMLAE